MAGARWGRFLRRFNKYGAERVTVRGISFDSKREAARWAELKLLEAAGEIRDLQRQVRYFLHVRPSEGVTAQAIGSYVADFVYVRCPRGVNWPGEVVVEDAKGVRTDLYRWKAKHFALEYGFPISEV